MRQALDDLTEWRPSPGKNAVQFFLVELAYDSSICLLKLESVRLERKSMAHIKQSSLMMEYPSVP